MDQHPGEIEVIRRLLEKHVPGIASGAVEIRGIARKSGNRSMVAVYAKGQTIDAVGAVVGNRGNRVKAIVAELDGEMFDVVRWSDSMDQFIGNLLAPKNVLRVSYDEIPRRATVTLAPDPMRLSSDVDPIRLRLGSELVGWDIVLR